MVTVWLHTKLHSAQLYIYMYILQRSVDEDTKEVTFKTKSNDCWTCRDVLYQAGKDTGGISQIKNISLRLCAV